MLFSSDDLKRRSLEEFSGLTLGDPRRTARARRLVAALAVAPSQSLPKATGGGQAALEGAYRFLNNRHVSVSALLEPHLSRTADRCVAAKRAIAIHDTTQVKYGGEEREGLGRLHSAGSGYLAHFSLCVSHDDGPAGVLGVAALETWTRSGPSRWKGKKKVAAGESEEPKRWLRAVENVADRVGRDVELTHVMDREGDAYPLLAGMVSAGHRFVVRLCHDRKVVGPEPSVKAALGALAPLTLTRDVHVSKRRNGRATPPKDRKRHPTRSARTAQLAFATNHVELVRPSGAPTTLPERLGVNVVRVWEPAPPADAEPIEWFLITSESVNNADAALSVVDIYRRRWIIEEYFKSLKTGCSLEKRELESLDALLRILALLIPIAVTLLELRDLPRVRPDAPATDVLTDTEVTVLRAILGQRKIALPEAPTIKAAMYGIAALGGHIKNNGEPGWHVLGRGYDDLCMYVAGWLAARREM